MFKITPYSNIQEKASEPGGLADRNRTISEQSQDELTEHSPNELAGQSLTGPRPTRANDIFHTNNNNNNNDPRISPTDTLRASGRGGECQLVPVQPPATGPILRGDGPKCGVCLHVPIKESLFWPIVRRAHTMRIPNCDLAPPLIFNLLELLTSVKPLFFSVTAKNIIFLYSFQAWLFLGEMRPSKYACSFAGSSFSSPSLANLNRGIVKNWRICGSGAETPDDQYGE